MSKFTYAERNIIINIVATLTLKRISDNEIINEIFNQTNKTMTVRNVIRIKQQIKKESFKWYTTLRNSHYVLVFKMMFTFMFPSLNKPDLT